MTRNDYNPDLREGKTMGPCIGLLELATIPRGVDVANSILWEADIEVLFSSPVQPGKYVILFTGSVEDVRSSLRRGAELAESGLVDQLIIEQVHDQVEQALRRRGGQINGELDAIGVVETTTVASAVIAADVALKTATVDLMDLRIANGLGGKSFFTLTGEVSDVRSAVAAASKSAQTSSTLKCTTVIPMPHPDLVSHL